MVPMKTAVRHYTLFSAHHQCIFQQW